MLQKDALGFSAGYRLYKTTDKYLCLALLQDAHWQALFNALGLEADAEQRGYLNRDTREKDDQELTERIQSVLGTDAASTWFAKLDAAGVPCEISDPDFMRGMWQEGSFMLERGWLVNLPHPVTGRIGHVGVPYQFSQSPASVQFRPLIVGEATREILTDLGYTEEQQQELFDTQVVADASCHPYELNLETA